MIRIVYDGAPEAGKTTNVQQLLGQISLQRRGTAKTPGSGGPRTEYFDWLDFSGGYIDGRRVRCQLISVPGQSALLHRRRYLLDTADTVVFVTDSRPDRLAESKDSFETTMRIVERLSGKVPVGVVLQANKQDLDGALPPSEVALAMGASALTPAVGSVASAGDGIMGTFVLAVRLATDRLRALLLEDPLSELPVSGETPEALYAAMLELERETHRAPTAPRRQERVEGSPYAGEPAAELVVEFEIAVRKPDTVLPGAERPNRVDPESAIALPVAQELASGHVWPPVKGRAALAIATTGATWVPASVHDWAPADAMEVVSDSGWVLHSAERWVFATEPEARLRLLLLARGLLARPETLPEGRTLAVARDGERWRLWLATPKLASLRDLALAALAERTLPALEAFIRTAATQLKRLSAAGLLDAPLVAGAGGVALEGDRIVILGLDEGDEEPRVAQADPIQDLSEQLAGSLQRDPELSRWFAEHGRRLLAG